MNNNKALVICVHNSARSQMAEAFINIYGQGKVMAESAGLEPGEINPHVIKVMKEIDVDISQNKTNNVFDLYKEGRLYKYIITVCDKEASEKCPIFPGIAKQLHWPFEDPSIIMGNDEEILSKIRNIRDQIKTKVISWLNEI